MRVHDYSKSRALFERAVKCIPSGIYGHLGPSSGCFVPVDAYPFYVNKMQDSYMWDIDGNRFIDYMCAYGPNILGYANPVVDEAYHQQAITMNATSLPAPVMVELAELLVETVDSADWAFFAKNGTDVTNYAMLVARAATGRRKVIKFQGGYHGTLPWMKSLGTPATLEEDVAHIITVPFNDIKAMEKAFATYPQDIACVIGTPYNHINFGDNILPAEGYWPQVRALCDKYHSVLIVDDVRCGFRLDLRGSDHYYGFKADLICFCKALANGYNISALCGREDLKSTVSDVFFTGSYWLAAAPMAAAVACIKEMHKANLPAVVRAQGEKLIAVMSAAARSEGFELVFSGEPALFYMRLANDANFLLHQAFVGECVRRGLFFTNHHNHFINLSLTDEDIKFTGEVAAEAFKTVKRAYPELLEV